MENHELVWSITIKCGALRIHDRTPGSLAQIEQDNGSDAANQVVGRNCPESHCKAQNLWRGCA